MHQFSHGERHHWSLLVHWHLGTQTASTRRSALYANISNRIWQSYVLLCVPCNYCSTSLLALTLIDPHKKFQVLSCSVLLWVLVLSTQKLQGTCNSCWSLLWFILGLLLLAVLVVGSLRSLSDTSSGIKMTRLVTVLRRGMATCDLMNKKSGATVQEFTKYTVLLVSTVNANTQ